MSSSWLERILPNVGAQASTERRASVPEGLWRKCPKCESVLYQAEVERNQYVCPKCQHHLRIGARQRIDFVLDAEG
ncbi:acetyl-CoA carboxylase carboxyl transferase subunit beta, partial [Acinetobacter baumannii]